MAGFLAVLVLLSLSKASESNPCSSYTLLDNPKRSTAYEMQPSDVAIHDYYTILQGNWYRFQTNGHSVEIPELVTGETVPSRHCGTQSPIWISGNNTHPAVPNIAAEVEVCTTYGLSSCDWSATISIQKCDGPDEFYVYRLTRPQATDIGYCAGEQMMCPPGQIWNQELNRCTDEPTTSSSTVKPTTPIKPTTKEADTDRPTSNMPATTTTSKVPSSTAASVKTSPVVGTSTPLKTYPSSISSRSTTRQAQTTTGNQDGIQPPCHMFLSWFALSLVASIFYMFGTVSVVTYQWLRRRIAKAVSKEEKDRKICEGKDPIYETPNSISTEHAYCILPEKITIAEMPIGTDPASVRQMNETQESHHF